MFKFATHGYGYTNYDLFCNIPEKLTSYVVSKTLIHRLGRSKQLAP